MSLYEESLEKDGIGVAWQYTKRLQKAEEEQSDPYWAEADLDLSKATVRLISRNDAKVIIEEYEWLGCMPAIVKYSYGIFFGDVCGGVVCFSTEYSENLGHWDKFGYTGKMLLLSRGVCLHWTPKNTGSKLIMSAIKMLPDGYQIITCTTDHLAGEVGTIYQACNFYYVGSMRDSNPNVKSRPKDRFGVIIDGKLYGTRGIRAKLGTQRKDVILQHYPDAKFVKQQSKHRYFLFRGSKKVRREHLSAIEHLVKPYIKREEK